MANVFTHFDDKYQYNGAIKDFIDGKVPCDVSRSNKNDNENYGSGPGVDYIWTLNGSCIRAKGTIVGKLTITGNGARDGVFDVQINSTNYENLKTEALSKYNTVKANFGNSTLGASGMSEYNDYIYAFRPVSSGKSQTLANGCMDGSGDNGLGPDVGNTGSGGSLADSFSLSDYYAGSSGSLTSTSKNHRIVVPNSNDSMQNMAVTITSEAGETRPVNKAVRYIVKVE